MTTEATFACSVEGHSKFTIKIVCHVIPCSFKNASLWFGKTW